MSKVSDLAIIGAAGLALYVGYKVKKGAEAVGEGVGNAVTAAKEAVGNAYETAATVTTKAAKPAGWLLFPEFKLLKSFVSGVSHVVDGVIHPSGTAKSGAELADDSPKSHEEMIELGYIVVFPDGSEHYTVDGIDYIERQQRLAEGLPTNNVEY